MNASLAQFTESLAAWLVDFYLLSTLLLVLTFVLFRWIRQPVHRLTVTWIVMIELAVLAVLCAVPSWPRISLMATAPKETRTPALTTTEKPSPKPSAAPSPISPDMPSDISPMPSAMPPDIMSDRVLNTPKKPSNKIATISADVTSTPVDPPSSQQPHETETTPWFLLPTWLGIGFLIGFGLVALWLCWGMLATAMLCRRAATAPSAIKAQLAEITRSSRLPRLLLSHRISSAAATGVLRPAILLPLEIAEKNSPQSLRAVLSHEWAHIRNHDLWLLTLGRCLLVLLYAHPLYWWLRRRIRNDQELVADAVAAGENRPDYAEHLLGWVRLTSELPPTRVPGAVGLWEVPSQLTRRITMLLDKAFIVKTATSRRWRYQAIGLMFLLGTACSLLTIQPARSEEKTPATLSQAEIGPRSVPYFGSQEQPLPSPLPKTPKPNLCFSRGSDPSPAAAQQMLKLPVRVVDPNGKPVAGAKVTPWALRCGQGHGRWGKNDKGTGIGPKEVVTDKDGTAMILYPSYSILQEHVRTSAVSLFVDHPKFAYVNSLHIDVPLEEKGPHEIKLTRGVPVEIRPLIDGRPTDLDNVYLFWSDGRSWLKDKTPEKTADGTLRIPLMRPGKNSVLAVKLDGQRATHFSKIVNFKLTAGKPKKIDVPLQPSVQVQGVLSDNVPRPVRQGRIKIETLPPAYGRVAWLSWAPIRPDGTFIIDGWPAGERMQLIALCDGYIATSGLAPDVVKNPRDPKKDSFLRPQVFDPDKDSRITVTMTPLVPCVVTTVDENAKPIAGVNVVSWPNVGWWNVGSQVYCRSLVRGERLLRERKYFDAVDKTFPEPFEGTTDAKGKVTLELPAGRERLAAWSDTYELPINLGSRDVRVKLEPGKTTEVTLRLQPVGTEQLGDWDRLAGVLFGCSTREGRKICEMPSVQKRIKEFTKRFDEAKNPRDPQLLSDAYNAVADTFVELGDAEGAAKWRKKANEQAEKAKAQKSPEK